MISHRKYYRVGQTTESGTVSFLTFPDLCMALECAANYIRRNYKDVNIKEVKTTEEVRDIFTT